MPGVAWSVLWSVSSHVSEGANNSLCCDWANKYNLREILGDAEHPFLLTKGVPRMCWCCWVSVLAQ